MKEKKQYATPSFLIRENGEDVLTGSPVIDVGAKKEEWGNSPWDGNS